MTRAGVNALAKGNRWRRIVADYFEASGWAVVVRGIGFAGDDLDVLRGRVRLSVEAKNHNRWAPSDWLDQAVGNAPAGSTPVVVAHRRGKPGADEAYVILRGTDFAALLDNACYPDGVDDIEDDEDIATSTT